MTIVKIGVLHINLAIPGSRSLKDKRRAMNSLKTRMRNRYNCSVAEVDFKDKWSRAQLAVCVISDDTRHLDEQLQEIARFSSTHHLAEMIDYSTEII